MWNVYRASLPDLFSKNWPFKKMHVFKSDPGVGWRTERYAFDPPASRSTTRSTNTQSRSTQANRHCTKCGKQTNTDHRFCPYCGSPTESRPNALECDHCARKLAKDDNFCPQCGKNVSQGLRCACMAVFRQGDKFCHSCGKTRPKS